MQNTFFCHIKFCIFSPEKNPRIRQLQTCKQLFDDRFRLVSAQYLGMKAGKEKGKDDHIYNDDYNNNFSLKIFDTFINLSTDLA